MEYIKGVLMDKKDNYMVIENNGIGYRVYTSLRTMGEVEMGDELKIHVDMVVREDDISLYGFYERDELKLFRMLGKVSGIGSKLALAVLSGLDHHEVVRSVAASDAPALTRVPGVGKKTAQRIILELKDKIEKEYGEAAFLAGSAEATAAPASLESRDAVDALMALGYGRSDAQTAVQSVYEDGMTAQTVIKEALKKLMKR